tara:strand:+ start:2142 stop:2564 length:423 start_codon:yes stop_codon:yes gene_type:complete
MKLRTILVLLALAASAPAQYSWRNMLDAIKQVETGSGSGIGVKGDGGRAFGPLQIHRGYFIDSRVKGHHSQCLTSRSFSELVVRRYMHRWCPDEARRLDAGRASRADAERVARTHNGGPRGSKKSATLAYGKRVLARLRR